MRKRRPVITAILVLLLALAGGTVAVLALAGKGQQTRIWSCPAPSNQDPSAEQRERAITTPLGPAPAAPARWWGGQEGAIRFAEQSFASFCGFIGLLMAPAGLQNLTVKLAVGEIGREVKECVAGTYKIPRNPDFCLADPFTRNGTVLYKSSVILYSFESLLEMAEFEPLANEEQEGPLNLQFYLLGHLVGLAQAQMDPASSAAEVFTSCIVGIWYGSQVAVGAARLDKMEEYAAKLPSPDAAMLGMQHRQLSYCLP